MSQQDTSPVYNDPSMTTEQKAACFLDMWQANLRVFALQALGSTIQVPDADEQTTSGSDEKTLQPDPAGADQ